MLVTVSYPGQPSRDFEAEPWWPARAIMDRVALFAGLAQPRQRLLLGGKGLEPRLALGEQGCEGDWVRLNAVVRLRGGMLAAENGRDGFLRLTGKENPHDVVSSFTFAPSSARVVMVRHRYGEVQVSVKSTTTVLGLEQTLRSQLFEEGNALFGEFYKQNPPTLFALTKPDSSESLTPASLPPDAVDLTLSLPVASE